jgi:MSHA biogenesis protein MshO
VGAASRGFTLVEAIIANVITALVCSVLALFLQGPVLSYLDTARRADATDAFESVAGRMTTELADALPNSVRSVTPTAVEFLPVKAHSRYRAALDDGNGDALDFDAADGSFDLLGSPIVFAGGEQIVVGNLGGPGADAYSGNTGADQNRRSYAGPVGSPVSTVVIASSNALPAASTTGRFDVVTTPVSYVCDPAARTLRRYWNYPITVTQAVPPAAGSNALVARDVSACAFDYRPGRPGGVGTLALRLAITRDGETVRLTHAVAIQNAP